jgi:hypothetical protein
MLQDQWLIRDLKRNRSGIALPFRDRLDKPPIPALGGRGDTFCGEFLPPVLRKLKSSFSQFISMKLSRALPMEDIEGLQ